MVDCPLYGFPGKGGQQTVTLDPQRDQLLDKCLPELSKQQRRILVCLWREGSVPTDELYQAVWTEPVNPETITKAIKRLNERLLQLQVNATLTMNWGYVILDRPD